jgi:hypothetical protein
MKVPGDIRLGIEKPTSCLERECCVAVEGKVEGEGEAVAVELSAVAVVGYA